MPAFLFLQKFVAGAPATMPLDDVADLLVEAGPILQEGDVYAVRLPPDRYAAHCTLIGNAESGVSCIGFEGPLHSEELRRRPIRQFCACPEMSTPDSGSVAELSPPSLLLGLLGGVARVKRGDEALTRRFVARLPCNPETGTH